MQTRHPLAAWIDGRTSQAAFADTVGCSESHLSLVLQRKRGVSLKLAQRFSGATGGEVPVEAFLWEPAEARA